MSAEQLFAIANLVAVLSWLALALLPRVRVVPTLITGFIVPMALAVAYSLLIAANWGGPGGFSTLADVSLLFSQPPLLLAGWIHYLAFDLLVGTWEANDARERGVPHLLLVPCLFLTFMFGPAGWLLYQAVRRLAARAPELAGAAGKRPAAAG